MRASFLLLVATSLFVGVAFLPETARGMLPYSRLWDMMGPPEAVDPFRSWSIKSLWIRPCMTVTLAHADWKETPLAHFITIDVLGVKKEDIKIEVEEGRVLRISGERKGDEEKEAEGDKWHRADRASQFRLSFDAKLDVVKAHLENGVLKVTIPKLAEGKARQPRVIDIVEDPSAGDIRPSTADLK
ncbi:hypothetical protein EJ110_NYTH34046 [Nymphaea thermarum]|nr:hypothetical protein EJ110_NYTH34046 [Nymphaea thermarum]